MLKTYNFSDPLKKQVDSLPQSELDSLFNTLSKLIYKLNLNGILSTQRTCFGCNFHQKNDDNDYCNLLRKNILNKEIRLDCPEYVEKATG